ncbi:A/G-specific adenine glycosylase [Leeuwenhoekiella polynyae]|uniref:Adenine DNA glycosylase n=1 Tax=Leeuwenhoekiella polynyae TaxID=1550906 RepID=A0A4V1KQY8_9FLAO|nr:A/G-specific adenine glycosylase [Leeuwenhoekiella polynyae]RXG23062.1 A/G-specific DNA-adenine glycosylase [Leeuwenhoekiella polynyae]
MLNFSNKLINWYLQNKRELPWRQINDPYRIWLSEIILQQTRVEQGTPYYFKFTEAFSDIKALADAHEDEVLKLWQGLGYYSRARNLHATAKKVAYELDGKFPDTYSEIKKLKGVGDYTASAIASICFDEATAVVDGNVYRVLSRIFGIDTPIDSTPGKKEFKALAQNLIDADDAANFNQAIMEFGATQCKPKNPYCLHCPFNEDCVAFQHGKIDKLPVKKGKIKVKNRFFNYLLFITTEGETVLNQREDKGIWRGLFDFPLLETEADLTKENFRDSVKDLKITGETKPVVFAELPVIDIILQQQDPIIHKLSHQKLHVKFWVIKLKNKSGLKTVSFDDFENYAVPRVIDRFMEGFDYKCFVSVG